MQVLAPSEFKTCCATLYEDKALQYLLGPSLHPGGLALTKRLAERIQLSANDRVLDVACGLGETPRFLWQGYGCKAFGVDLSMQLAREARAGSRETPIDFASADGEHLPFRGDTFTAVVSECSMCLLPRTTDGLAEIFRVLKSSGRLGITDIAVGDSLPPELDDVLMRFLCVSREIMQAEYSRMLEAAGFQDIELRDESSSLRELVETVKKRLFLAELLIGIGKLSLDHDQLERAKRLVQLAGSAVEQGRLRYISLIARKPGN